MTQVQPKVVPKRIADRLEQYSTVGTRWGAFYLGLGIIGVVSSAAVAAFAVALKDNNPYLLATITMIAAACNGIVTFSEARKYYDNMWDAWKYLNGACTQYELALITEEELAKALEVSDSYLQTSKPPYTGPDPKNAYESRQGNLDSADLLQKGSAKPGASAHQPGG